MTDYTVYVDQAAAAAADSRSWAEIQNEATPLKTLKKAIDGDISGGVLAAGDTLTIRMKDVTTRYDYSTTVNGATSKCVAQLGNITHACTNITIDTQSGNATDRWKVTGEFYLVQVGAWGGTLTVKHLDLLNNTNIHGIDFTANSAANITVQDSIIAWASGTYGTGTCALLRTGKTLTGSLTFARCTITGGPLLDHQSAIPAVTFDDCTIQCGSAAAGSAWFSNGHPTGDLSMTGCTVTFYASLAGLHIAEPSAGWQAMQAGAVWDFTGTTITATALTSPVDCGYFIYLDKITSGTWQLILDDFTLVASSALNLISLGSFIDSVDRDHATQTSGDMVLPTIINSEIRNTGAGGSLYIGCGLPGCVLHDLLLQGGASSHSFGIASNDCHVYNLFCVGSLTLMNWGDNNHIHDCVCNSISGGGAPLYIGSPATFDWSPTSGGHMHHIVIVAGPACEADYLFSDHSDTAGLWTGHDYTTSIHDIFYCDMRGTAADRARLALLDGAARADLAALRAEWVTLGMPGNEANSLVNQVRTVQVSRRR